MILRPSHELTISACNLVNLSVLTEAESSNVFVDPMLERPPKVLAWQRRLKTCKALFRR